MLVWIILDNKRNAFSQALLAASLYTVLLNVVTFEPQYIFF